MDQHLDVESCSTGPVLQRPDKDQTGKTKHQAGAYSKFKQIITMLLHIRQLFCGMLYIVMRSTLHYLRVITESTMYYSSDGFPLSHLESQSPAISRVFSWVRIRLNWASSLVVSWISLFLSLKLILKRFRYSSITSWSSETFCRNQ